MAKHPVQPGAVIDGFTIGECVHSGGMATLWSVTRPDIAAPLLMKIPRVSEGEDPAAIVSFEMEQMILPRLSGPHVPACYAAGDFMRQAYVVIERHPGHHALWPAWRTAAALRRGQGHRRKDRNRAGRPAPAERHPSRYQAEQHHVSPHRRSRADRLRTVASQPVAGSAAGGVPASLRHRALYGARAPARGARRSAQRPVFAGRAAVLLHHRRAAVRRERNPARHAAAAVARSLSAAQTQAGLSALAAGNRAAVPGDRSGLALSHGIATRVRSRPSRPGQADRAGGAAEPRSDLAPSGAAASTAI